VLPGVEWCRGRGIGRSAATSESYCQRDDAAKIIMAATGADAISFA